MHQKQVIAMGPGKTNAPGKCFMKLKEQNGDTNWYEVFCEGQTKYFQKAKQGLKDLGFPISQEDLNSKSFGKTTAIAMIEFQKENDLAYGGLDQTTLYHILKAVQEKK